ncbi:S1C family serine protease [Xylanibacillus composti]|nr:trypsin-like peptidase domain-containing protein [Xylanibacillus composti]
MRWFRDDFYSPRLSRRARRELLGGGSFKRRWPEWLGSLPFVSAAALMSIVCAAFVLVGAGIALAVVKPWQAATQQQADQPAPTQAMPEGGMSMLHELIVEAVEKVNPSIVTILSGIGDADSVMELGMGSGVIYEIRDGRARIVTNMHVIDEGTVVEVVLPSGERKKADILGGDVLSDLAVVEVDASGIKQAAEFGDSSKLKAGQAAIAIGNPLGLNYALSVTAGIISSPQLTIRMPAANGSTESLVDVIQTDAAINWGNSGGALIDLQGRVIGINSMKVAQSGVEGLGFALPINEVRPIVQMLAEEGRVLRPLMGVRTQDLGLLPSEERARLNLPDHVHTGLVIVEASAPASHAGLQADDVIVQLDHQPVRDFLELRKYLYDNKTIGDTLEVTYYRNGKKQTATITLADNAGQ